MARIPRQWILYDHAFFHVTWQCHNRDWLLRFKWAKKLYYKLLLKYKSQYSICFFSYIFMDNHIHLSGCLESLDKFSAFFRVVNSVFAKEVNKRLGRCGQVVRDRFKSPCLQSEQALIQEMVYHDLNEVRAGKSIHPQDNEMSSYAHYAFGKADPLITDPEFYIQLGRNPQERQAAYREMVDIILEAAPRKRDGRYTQEQFIGDPEWVAKKYAQLKEIRQNLRKLGEDSQILPSPQAPPG